MVITHIIRNSQRSNVELKSSKVMIGDVNAPLELKGNLFLR